MNKKLIIGIIMVIVIIGVLVVVSGYNFNTVTNTNFTDNKSANTAGRNITIELNENMKIGESP